MQEAFPCHHHVDTMKPFSLSAHFRHWRAIKSCILNLRFDLLSTFVFLLLFVILRSVPSRQSVPFNKTKMNPKQCSHDIVLTCLEFVVHFCVLVLDLSYDNNVLMHLYSTAVSFSFIRYDCFWHCKWWFCIYAYAYAHTYVRTYIHTYMFVVNFDALAQASNFQIERTQVVFLCWMQDLNQGLWNQISSRLNARWQTDWAIEDQTIKLELNSPSLWSASIQPIQPHCHLAFAPGSGDIHACCC